MLIYIVSIMGWDIARSRYCTTSFVKSLNADFLKDGLFNSRLFNAPKAKNKFSVP